MPEADELMKNKDSPESVKLTPKQQRFIEEYLVDLNATQAAKRAGYSQKTAYSIGEENLRKPAIAQKIKELQEELSKKTKLTHEWVLQKLEECVSKSMQEEEIKKWDNFNKELVGTGKYVYDSKGATKALELIGKHLGMFKDNLNITGDLEINVTIEDDDEDAKG